MSAWYYLKLCLLVIHHEVLSDFHNRELFFPQCLHFFVVRFESFITKPNLGKLILHCRRSLKTLNKHGHTLSVAGLPQSGSWQDLKDHMREAGDVCYADVFRDGTGVVEFVRKEDMTYAVRKLDNTKFRSHEVCRLVWFVMDCVFFAVSR